MKGFLQFSVLGFFHLLCIFIPPKTSWQYWLRHYTKEHRYCFQKEKRPYDKVRTFDWPSAANCSHTCLLADPKILSITLKVIFWTRQNNFWQLCRDFTTLQVNCHLHPVCVPSVHPLYYLIRCFVYSQELHNFSCCVGEKFQLYIELVKMLLQYCEAWRVLSARLGRSSHRTRLQSWSRAFCIDAWVRFTQDGFHEQWVLWSSSTVSRQDCNFTWQPRQFGVSTISSWCVWKWNMIIKTSLSHLTKCN